MVAIPMKRKEILAENYQLSTIKQINDVLWLSVNFLVALLHSRVRTTTVMDVNQGQIIVYTNFYSLECIVNIKFKLLQINDSKVSYVHLNLIYDLILDNHDALLDPMDLLDPELRPIPPQPGCEPSMQIYQDHRRVSNTCA